MKFAAKSQLSAIGVALLAFAVAAHAADKKSKPAAKPAPAAPATAPAPPSTPSTPVNPSLPVLTGPLVWRGDITTARGFMTDLAKQYEKDKKFKLALSPFSTLSGLDAAVAGTADFAGSARPGYEKRSEEAPLRFVPVAYDAVVLITSPANPVSNLNLKDVWRLYYGKTTNWKELGGRDAGVNMYAVAGPLDGVEFSLRAMIFRNGDQRVAVPRLYLNATKLEEGISLDPAGVGASTLSGTSGNVKVKMLNIEGVAPSLANIGNGSYPLYAPLYLAYREDAPRAAQVKEFIAWLDTPAAKSIFIKHQLLPYSDAASLVANDSERLAMIETKVSEVPLAAPSASLAAQIREAPTSPATAAAKEKEAQARARRESAKEAAAQPAPEPAKPAPLKAKAKDIKPQDKKDGGG